MAVEIDVRCDQILLKDARLHFKPHQLAQIRFWKFEENEAGGRGVLFAPLDRQRLLKLLGYTQAEGIACNLTGSCLELVRELEVERGKFEEARKRAQEFKASNNGTEEFHAFCSKIQACAPRKLKTHQLRAAYHLALVGNGANFSVPGSGKTAVVLAVYEMLRRSGSLNMLVVVGPPSSFRPWMTEFELTLGRKADHRVLAGGNRGFRKSSYYGPHERLAELYLASFQTMLNDADEMCFMLAQKGISAFLVVDEAHYIKQLNGDWASAVLRIGKLARHRCILTGTPMPRSYTDLFNLFDFLWLDRTPLDGSAKVAIEISEQSGNCDNARNALVDRIGPLFYRTKKKELGLETPVFHDPELIQMMPIERRIYDAIFHKIRVYAKEDYLKNIDVVTRLYRGRMIRLRQCVSYVGLLRKSVEGYGEALVDSRSEIARLIVEYDSLEAPAKLTRLRRMVKSFSESETKILIWTNFIGSINLIEAELARDGHYCKSIYGEVPVASATFSEEETRESIIAEFLDNNSGLNVLIANPAACAESISLHKTCQHAIYYDLSYNCAQYLQSLDRIHRVGGSEDRAPHYYFLQYADTVDADIKSNLNEKARKMEEIIDNDYSAYSLDMLEEPGDAEACARLFGNG